MATIIDKKPMNSLDAESSAEPIAIENTGSDARSSDMAPVEFGMGNTLLERAYRAFGPLFGGMVLDYTDFITVGPMGPLLGLLIGFPVGYWISRMYGFSSLGRGVFALFAALYCALPRTNLIPLATIISCAARFFRDGTRGSESSVAKSTSESPPPSE